MQVLKPGAQCSLDTEFLENIARQAGFEWGSGFYINPTSPEEAAEFLRAVKLP